MMTLGQFLTIKREAMKWSRQQIADSFGVSYNTVYQWETGKKPPNDKYMKGICKHYGFSMSEFKSQFPAYEEGITPDMVFGDTCAVADIPTISEDIPALSNLGTGIKFTQHAFPLNILKSRVEIAKQVSESTGYSPAFQAFGIVLNWIAELEGKE
jgi:transcriptional regulator with XRE-family HTH domain